MTFLQELLPIVIYVLLIILLVIGIILGVKAISALGKVEKVVDDVNKKVESLNGFFSIIDFTTDKIVSLSNRLIDGIAMAFSRLFSRKKKNKESKVKENEEWENEE